MSPELVVRGVKGRVEQLTAAAMKRFVNAMDRIGLGSVLASVSQGIEGDTSLRGSSRGMKPWERFVDGKVSEMIGSRTFSVGRGSKTFGSERKGGGSWALIPVPEAAPESEPPDA